MNGYHSPSSVEAQESLKALESTRRLNVTRLQRPRRYWVMLASFMVIFMLIPLSVDVFPTPAAYFFAPGLIILIGFLASWKQPKAARKIQVGGKMWLPYIGGAILLGLIGGLNGGLYSFPDRWWLPLLTAPLMFLLVLVGGQAMDRYWARTVSYPHEQDP